MSEIDAGDYIAKYVDVRDKVKEIKDRHKTELKPYNDALVMIENVLLGALNDQKLESFKAGGGTAYKTTRTSVKVLDFELALDYIRDNDLWHFLEKRLAKTAVTEFVESHKSNFPGTDIINELTVQIRRGK